MADASASQALALMQSPNRRISAELDVRKGKPLKPLAVLDAVLESSGNKIYVETHGTVEEIGGEVASMSSILQLELIKNAKGAKREEPIQLPKPVEKNVLELMVEYARFHSAPGRSDKERKLFDEKFVRLNTRTLCELTSAADSLDIKPLVDLTSRALARLIEGKTPEEIRETFNLPDDLTEEEKLEPVKAATEDPRIRLLNKYYAKKRKELQERKALEPPPVVQEDTRTVEELLSFIGAANDGQQEAKSKAKAKKKKKKGGVLGQGNDSDAAGASGPAGAAEQEDSAASPSGALADGEPGDLQKHRMTGNLGPSSPTRNGDDSSRSCSTSPLQISRRTPRSVREAESTAATGSGGLGAGGLQQRQQQHLQRELARRLDDRDQHDIKSPQEAVAAVAAAAEAVSAAGPAGSGTFPAHGYESQGLLSYVPQLSPHIPPTIQLFTRLTSLSEFRGRQVSPHPQGNGHADRLTDDEDGEISSSELLSNADDDDELLPTLAVLQGARQQQADRGVGGAAATTPSALSSAVQQELSQFLQHVGLAGTLQVVHVPGAPACSAVPAAVQQPYSADRRLPDGSHLTLQWRLC